MDIESLWEYCISKPFSEESFPFDQEHVVFKVKGKMFALFNVEQFKSINLKCDPERAIELREQFSAVQPGYHMNKKHWNTVVVNDDLSDKEVLKLIDHSYELVVKSLPKKIQNELSLG
jgi:predicted DNA-binding protein (MmcQ/YjbR family)